MSDPVAAVVEILDAQLGVPVYGASFRGEPPGALVRASGGGSLTIGFLPSVDATVDVRVYHDSDWEASKVDRQVRNLLHNVQDVSTSHGLVRWCALSGGPNQLQESDTGWPLVLTTWQVYGDFFAIEEE